MFDISWSELFLVGAVALLVVGPKELPELMRSVGRAVRAVRRLAGEFQGHWDELLRESELDELRRKTREMEASAARATDVANRRAAEAEARAAAMAAGTVPAAAAVASPGFAHEFAHEAVDAHADAHEDDAFAAHTGGLAYAGAPPAAGEELWDRGPAAPLPPPVMLPDPVAELAPAAPQPTPEELAEQEAAAHRPWRAPIRNF